MYAYQLPPYISYKLYPNGVIYDIDGYVYQIALYITEKYELTYKDYRAFNKKKVGIKLGICC